MIYLIALGALWGFVITGVIGLCKMAGRADQTAVKAFEAWVRDGR